MLAGDITPAILPAGSPVVSCTFHHTADLPARLAAFARLAAIASASSAASASAKSLAAALWTIGLWLGFVDSQRPSTQFSSVERGNGLVRRRGIGHLHESETARAARLPAGNECDFFYRAVRLEHIAQFGLGRAVGQIADIQILHCISSLSTSSQAGCP